MIAILAYSLALPVGAQQPPQPKPGHVATITVATPTPVPPNDVDMAMNNPDEFAWVLFTRVAKLASTQPIMNGVKLNNSVFETWADDGLTFPTCPNLKTPPQWPKTAEEASPKHFVPSLKIQIHNTLVGTKIKELGIAQTVAAPEIIPPSQPGAPIEEVRRNKESFDFIIKNNLWYQEGLAGAFAKGTTLVFPIPSIEVKANWVQIDPKDKDKYHWNYEAVTGKYYGMVAMHIISKTIPNWTWQTFEWVDNAGRCDYMGCRDSFGANPPYLPPNPKLGQQYVSQPTQQVLDLFKSLGATPQDIAAFTRYRLKGTQLDFVDPTGQTLLLGNSITEDGFVRGSSCITCHSQAGFDGTGSPNPTIGFTSYGQSLRGSPDPMWMWDTSVNPPAMAYMQADFVWAVFRASCAGTNPNICQKKSSCPK